MGLKDCSIRLDNPNNAYYPGQTLNGQVVYTFDTSKKVRGIKIEFRGEAATRWTTKESRTNTDGKTEDVNVDYTGKEEYFTIHYYLLGSKSGNEIEIPSGTHTYPFTCALPPTLPSSFEGEYGYIRYTIKVTLDRPWKFDQETKTAFTVVGMLDLNLNPKYKAPMRLNIEKNFCCLCCQSGPVSVDLCLPVSGFCSGQSIPLDINVENGSSVDIDEIKIKLVKVCTYRAEFPSSENKTISLTITEVKAGGASANTTSNLTKSLEIPALPPSNLDNCGIIDLDYNIILKMSPSGAHFDTEAKTILTIGTVPLIDFQPPQPMLDKMVANPAESSAEPLLVASAPPETPGVTLDQPSYPAPKMPYPYPPTNPTYAAPGYPPYPQSGPYPNMAPPFYQASQFGTTSIRDTNDNQHTMLPGDAGFAPRYPMYGFYLPPK